MAVSAPAEARESETTRRERIVWEAEIIRRLIPLGQGKKGVWMEGWEKPSRLVSELTILLSSVFPDLASRVLSTSLSRGFGVFVSSESNLESGRRFAIGVSPYGLSAATEMKPWC